MKIVLLWPTLKNIWWAMFYSKERSVAQMFHCNKIPDLKNYLCRALFQNCVTYFACTCTRPNSLFMHFSQPGHSVVDSELDECTGWSSDSVRWVALGLTPVMARKRSISTTDMLFFTWKASVNGFRSISSGNTKRHLGCTLFVLKTTFELFPLWF